MPTQVELGAKIRKAVSGLAQNLLSPLAFDLAILKIDREKIQSFSRILDLG